MVSVASALVAVVALASTVMSLPVAGTSSLMRRVTHSGSGTWFNPALGACGGTNDDNDMIVAIPHGMYYDGDMCGRMVEITSKGHTHQAKVVDKCMGCSNGDLDMSPTLFQGFADLGVGRIDISWHYMSRN